MIEQKDFPRNYWNISRWLGYRDWLPLKTNRFIPRIFHKTIFQSITTNSNTMERYVYRTYIDLDNRDFMPSFNLFDVINTPFISPSNRNISNYLVLIPCNCTSLPIFDHQNSILYWINTLWRHIRSLIRLDKLYLDVFAPQSFVILRSMFESPLNMSSQSANGRKIILSYKKLIWNILK